MPLQEARISPLDRGFLYSDGCYEVTPVYGGRPFRFDQHHDRLTRSLREIRMEDPLAREAWRDLYRELIKRNNHDGDLYIYVQVTRGAENGRNHAPLPDVPRSVFAFASPWPEGRAGWRENGLPAVTAEDTRWARCDIKSVSLLANVLLRQLAVDANASETILIRDGQLTDASASSVHVVIGGELDTRWARCDIKSVSLLANVLLRQLAVDANASETILIRDGQLTDASASSVHVVIGGELRTPPNSWKLLPGTTR